MKLPTVKELALALAPIKTQAKIARASAAEGSRPDEWYIPVRVRVCEDGGGWSLHKGEIQFEDDHTGYTGVEYVDPNSNLKAVAASILQEITDHIGIHTKG